MNVIVNFVFRAIFVLDANESLAFGLITIVYSFKKGRPSTGCTNNIFRCCFKASLYLLEYDRSLTSVILILYVMLAPNRLRQPQE